eukprot:739286_1
MNVFVPWNMTRSSVMAPRMIMHAKHDVAEWSQWTRLNIHARRVIVSSKHAHARTRHIHALPNVCIDVEKECEEGACEEELCACAREFDPYCCDEKTHSNPYEACARCNGQKFINFKCKAGMSRVIIHKSMNL